MKILIVKKSSRIKYMNLTRDQIIYAAMNELLDCCDNFYRETFKGTPAKPEWNIPTKNARRVMKSLKNKKRMPNITIDEEFLK